MISNTIISQVCGSTFKHCVQLQPGEAQVAVESLVRTFKHSCVLDEEQKMHTVHLNEPGGVLGFFSILIQKRKFRESKITASLLD